MLSMEQVNANTNIMRSASPFPLCRTSLGLISLLREILFLLNFLHQLTYFMYKKIQIPEYFPKSARKPIIHRLDLNSWHQARVNMF